MLNLQKDLKEYAIGSELDFIVEPSGNIEDVRLDEEIVNEKKFSEKGIHISNEILQIRNAYKNGNLSKSIYSNELINILYFSKHFNGIDYLGQKARFFLKKLNLSDQDIEKMEKEKLEDLGKEIMEDESINKQIIKEASKATKEIEDMMTQLIQNKTHNSYIIAFISDMQRSFAKTAELSNLPSNIIAIAKGIMDIQTKRGCYYIVNNNPTNKDLAFVGQHAPDLLN